MRLESELEAEDVKGFAKTVLGELRELQEVDTVYIGIGWDNPFLPGIQKWQLRRSLVSSFDKFNLTDPHLRLDILVKQSTVVMR